MKRNDLIRIRHILDAVNEALSFARNRTRADLASDRMLTLSLIKSIELMGEAASKVSSETREENPRIPWESMIAMRNRLIHVYFDIDVDRVWDTVTEDLPVLKAAVEETISSEDVT